MKFDFAISFARNERELARSVANALRDDGLRVFFDEYFEHEMLGRDGADYLNDIFFRQARFCVALVSRNYEQRAWAQLERRAAQARELYGEPGYLIPVLVEGFRPDWLLPTRIYFDLKQRGLSELVSVLKRKIAAGKFGPYMMRAEFEGIYGEKPLSISAVRDGEEFVLWCTCAREQPQQIRRVFKDEKSESWSLDALPLREQGRYVFVTHDLAVVIPDYGDQAIRIHDLPRSRLVKFAIPRSGKWRLVTDCKFDGRSLLLAYCGGDAWHLDLNRLEPLRLQAGSDETDYCYVDFVSDRFVAVGVGKRLFIHSLADRSTTCSYELPEEIHALAYVPSSRRLVVGGFRHLYTLEFPSGEVRHRHELALQGVFNLARAHQTGIIAFTTGLQIAPNVLELFDTSTGISLAQIESGKWEAWEAVAISGSGSSIAAVRGRKTVVFEA